MTAEQKLQELEEHRKKVLDKKALEYTYDDDRFGNFKSGARWFAKITGMPFDTAPEYMIIAYLTKHLASIDDLLKNSSKLTKEILFEKCGDALNYIDLFVKFMDDGKHLTGDGVELCDKIAGCRHLVETYYLQLVEQIYTENKKDI
jgi:hypothetical protein